MGAAEARFSINGPVNLLPFSLRNSSARFVHAAGRELLIMFKLASRYRRDVEAATSAQQMLLEGACLMEQQQCCAQMQHASLAKGTAYHQG